MNLGVLNPPEYLDPLKSLKNSKEFVENVYSNDIVDSELGNKIIKAYIVMKKVYDLVSIITSTAFLASWSNKSKPRPGKSCKRRLRTFCQKSRYFEDILCRESRIFVVIYSRQLMRELCGWRIDN